MKVFSISANLSSEKKTATMFPVAHLITQSTLISTFGAMCVFVCARACSCVCVFIAVNGQSFKNLLMSPLMTKPKWHVRPVKPQISRSIRPVLSGYSLCAQWVVKDPSFLHADSED